MTPRRGEVWWVDFGRPVGSEPDKIRPAVLLQNHSLSGLRTRLVVPLTSNPELARHRGNIPLPRGEAGLLRDSVAVGHLATAADLSRFHSRLGTLSDDYLTDVELAVAYCFGFAL